MNKQTNKNEYNGEPVKHQFGEFTLLFEKMKERNPPFITHEAARGKLKPNGALGSRFFLHEKSRNFLKSRHFFSKKIII